MNKLKTQLLMLGRDRGDTGSNEEQRQLIEVFFQVLQVYLTPAAIQSFSLDQLRLAYIKVAQLFNEFDDLKKITEEFGLLIHLTSYPRSGPPETPVSSTSVVDIFKRKA